MEKESINGIQEKLASWLATGRAALGPQLGSFAVAYSKKQYRYYTFARDESGFLCPFDKTGNDGLPGQSIHVFVRVGDGPDDYGLSPEEVVAGLRSLADWMADCAAWEADHAQG